MFDRIDTLKALTASVIELVEKEESVISEDDGLIRRTLVAYFQQPSM